MKSNTDVMAQPPVTMTWVWATLALYVAGFAAFWPRAFLIVDEERYVTQAAAFAAGARVLPGAGIIYPPESFGTIVDYPPGTSLLQTPFVWALGWRGGALLSVVSLIVATIATASWLRARGRQPGFALLLPGVFAVAFFGRIAMSDVPSTALAAVTCWLLWRAADSERRAAMLSLLAGFCAGVSLSFREPLVLLFAPLMLGAIVRRQVATLPLIVGGVVGVALKFALAAWLFGDAWHVRGATFPFRIGALPTTIPIYAILLLLLFPGAALLPIAYRGERRAELVAGVCLYLTLFLLFDWDAFHENGYVKGLILNSRYVAPLAPVFAFMASDVWPRWYAWIRARVPGASLLPRAAALAGAAVALGVHPLAARQESEARTIVQAIYSRTSADIPVVTNGNATIKYLSPAYGPRRLIQRYDLPPDTLTAFSARYGKLHLVLMDRSDNEFSRNEARANAEFLAMARERCRLAQTLEQPVGSWAVVRIFDMSDCGKRAAP